MAKSNYHIEPLRKDNFDTWSVQAQAVLIKNRLWEYVDGTRVRPDGDEGALAVYDQHDLLARSELLLLMSPSELKLVKNCRTSKDVWTTLKTTYQSKGPARKATLLKQVILKRMCETDDARDHLNEFLDIVDKLKDMNIEINSELLSIIMLYSLPTSFENFRIAIETRDTLPKPEDLKVKIIEESEARRNKSDPTQSKENDETAFYSKRKGKHYFKYRNEKNENKEEFQFKCHKCHKKGHKAKDCWSKKKSDTNFKIEEVCMNSGSLFASKKENWCLDSGCTSHMCNNENTFEKIYANEENKMLKLAAEDQIAKVQGKGKVILNIKNRNINLWNTLYVQKLSSNLISVAKITEKGHTVLFDNKKATVKNKEGEIVMKAIKENGLYYVQNENEMANIVNESEIRKWHMKLAHVNEADLKMALKNKAVKGLKFSLNEKLNQCETCIKGKMARLPFPKGNAENRTTEKLQIIHSDICGPIKEVTPGGAKYFVTFIDEYSRYCRVYFMKHKNEVLEKFIDYKNEAENFSGNKIKYLQTDNGRGEYTNKKFENYLKNNGILRRITVPYTPEQNGMAERKNRTLQEKARCMLIESKLPKMFWAEAIYTSNYLCNRIPTRTTDNKTPFEKWVGYTPSVHHLQVFGSKVHVLWKGKTRGKFESKTDDGIFMGYSEIRKAYRIWLPNKNKMITSRDVKIMNKMYYEDENPAKKVPEPRENQNFEKLGTVKNDTIKITVQDDITSDCSNEYDDTTKLYTETIHNIENETSASNGRPRRERRAPIWTNDYSMISEEKMQENSKWEEAIKLEIKAHIKNNTWDIIENKEGKNKITCKIILKEKLGVDGKVERKKARLVARGFTQIHGIDYNETFAPVSKLSSIRTLLAVAVEKNMNLNQLDVTTAYLNGIIKEYIIMEKPKNLEKYLSDIILEESNNEDKNILNKAKEMLNKLKKPGEEKVCKLNKAIYGLKQAGREWYEKLDRKLKEMEFVPSIADPCIYILSKGRAEMIISIYVDDIIIAYSDEKMLKEVKQKLTNAFEMRDLGQLNYCLGIQFEAKEGEILASQTEYIKTLLKRFNMEDCKTVNTPMELGLRLEKNEKVSNFPYQNLIGSLMFAAVATRPDIMYVVSYLSQFNTSFGEEHWKAAKRVLRYLKGTLNVKLSYRKTGRQLEGFADADWAACTIDRRSYTGYCFKYGGSVISWEAKKQRTVALSTAEAEYMALTEAAKEAIHLKQLLSDMGIKIDTVKIWNDNQAAQNLAKNPVTNKRSKHINIREHFIRENVNQKIIEVAYMKTEDMEADLFTKSLPGVRLNDLMKMIGFSYAREGEC